MDSSNSATKLAKHAPKRRPNQQFLAADNLHLNFNPINASNFDESLFSMTIYPSDYRQSGRGATYTFEQTDGFDPQNKLHLKKFNQWRFQIFTRLGVIEKKHERKRWSAEEVAIFETHPEFHNEIFSDEALVELSAELEKYCHRSIESIERKADQLRRDWARRSAALPALVSANEGSAEESGEEDDNEEYHGDLPLSGAAMSAAPVLDWDNRRDNGNEGYAGYPSCMYGDSEDFEPDDSDADQLFPPVQENANEDHNIHTHSESAENVEIEYVVDDRYAHMTYDFVRGELDELRARILATQQTHL